MQQQNARKMLERELREKEQMEITQRAAAAEQSRQLKAQQQGVLKRYEDSILEGEILRKKAEEDMYTDQKAALKRRGDTAEALVQTKGKSIPAADARRGGSSHSARGTED